MNEQIEKVIAERKNQDEKWGEQNHSPLLWLSIIREKFGEMYKEANEYGFSSDLKKYKTYKLKQFNVRKTMLN